MMMINNGVMVRLLGALTLIVVVSADDKVIRVKLAQIPDSGFLPGSKANPSKYKRYKCGPKQLFDPVTKSCQSTMHVLESFYPYNGRFNKLVPAMLWTPPPVPSSEQLASNRNAVLAQNGDLDYLPSDLHASVLSFNDGNNMLRGSRKLIKCRSSQFPDVKSGLCKSKCSISEVYDRALQKCRKVVRFLSMDKYARKLQGFR